MALNTTYLLRHIQHIEGQQIENVYFFNHAAGDGLATDLCLDFEAQWLPTILDMQVGACITDGIAAYNLGDLGDFSTLPLSSNGTFGFVQYLPSFNAINFTLKLNTRAVRPGSKRIAGIPEEVTAGNNVVDEDYLGLMDALRLKYQANMVGASDTWSPIVVKRVKTAIPDTDPVQYRYNLPTTDLALVTGSVVAALTTPVVSSQVSRKGA